ncbi:MAG: coproporphyrinogen III oxidase, partial [Burkholderiales bacterium]
MFPAEVLKQFDLNGPRYTSYPTADRFTPTFQPTDYDRALRDAQRKPVSLYVHVPFCRSLCYYCACNKIISKSATIADEYLDVLTQETALVAQAQPHLPVVQLAFGGGTP